MSDNEIVIEINGNNLSGFISGSVSRKMDQFCGTFDFITTKDLINTYNIDAQSYCNIYINKKKALTGIIDKTSPSEDPDGSEVQISGRDITCDIVDSSLPYPISLSGDFNLVTVVQKVVQSFDLQDKIKVINKITDLPNFTSEDIISADEDKNAFEFMNDYAEKVGAILITDRDGNIVITRAGSDVVSDKILNCIPRGANDTLNQQNNVVSSSAGYDYSQRYYKYVVISQDNLNTSTKKISTSSNENEKQKAVSNQGVAYDNQIRTSRVLRIKAQNACSSATCEEIATLEANIRRANSLKYSCEVVGFQLNNGELYALNQLMQVRDDDNEINSQLLINGVTFNFGDGATTSLDFGYKDAYTLQANLNSIDSRTNKTKDNKQQKNKKGKGKGKSKEDVSKQIAELNKLLGL